MRVRRGAKGWVGQVAEGIDFDKHYGRAVVIIGIPFQYTLSKILRARLEYMKNKCVQGRERERAGDIETSDKDAFEHHA